MTTHSRPLVRTAIAQFFGGTTFDPIARAYRGNGPLQSSGLSTVRAYQAKRIPDTDYVSNQAAGRGMGAAMVVGMPHTKDNLWTGPGLPAGVHGGQRHLIYPVQLHFFHLAHEPYAEDAEADVDALAQAVVELIYTDPTLGTGTSSPPLIYQAGMSRAGIETLIDPSEAFHEMTLTYFQVNFDAEVVTIV